MDLTDKSEFTETIKVKAVIHNPPDVSKSSSNDSRSNGSGPSDATPEPSIPEETENIKCTKCDLMCKSENELTMHIADQHPVQISPEFNCPNCDMKFTEENTLKEHANDIHTATEYNCDLCDYKSDDRELLDTHKNFSHVAEKFACNVCANMFEFKLPSKLTNI